MKKITALLLAVFMMFSLISCVGGTSSTTDAGTNQTQSKSDKKKMSFTEFVAIDNSECAITITEIDSDNIWGYTLNAQLENKSTEKTYMFAVDDASINGVVCDPLFATEVAAGKKANKGISFPDNELEENGVGDYTDIEITFRVYDSNDWGADAVAKETIHVYPYGEENAAQFVRQSQSTDNVIIDNEYATVIVTGYEDDSIWGYTVNLFLLNKTNKEVMFP